MITGSVTPSSSSSSLPKPQQQKQDQQGEGPKSSFSSDVHSLPTLADITGKREVPQKDTSYGVNDGDAENNINSEGNATFGRFRCFGALLVSMLLLALGAGLGVGLTHRGEYFNEEYNHDPRYHDVVDHLALWEVSDYADLLNHDTPQYLAAHWIAHEDPQQINIPVGESLLTQNGYAFAARYVLALLYFAMGGSTNQWSDDLNFLSDNHYCDWFQIIVSANDNQMLPRGVGCNFVNYDEKTNPNSDIEIDTLFLDNNNLVGSVPTEMGILTTLRVLNMDINNINGEIPQQLFLQLSSLEHISLSNNVLSGSFPQWINSYHDKVLQSIDLSHNMLTGELPRDLGFITSLRALALGHNMLNGKIDHIFNNYYALAGSGATPKGIARPATPKGIANLELLYLNDNSFTGTIDDSFLRSMTNLRQLDLSDNSLDGSIPQHFFEFPKLEALDLHNNDNICDQLPSEIPPNDMLTYLALHQNNIVGPIPTSIQKLEKLQYLDLSDNKLTSFIPSEIGSLSNLWYLFVGKNDFQEGTIPMSLMKLTNLQELSLKSTRRTGTIPKDIFSHYALPRLVLLDIENNSLHGSIPSSIGTIRNLEFLCLDKNMLTGTIPNEFENLISLQLLLVDGNELHGDMGVFCDKPSDFFKPYLTADCGVGDIEIECDCCFLCCTNHEPCDDNSLIPSLNPTRQFYYNRGLYGFENRTALFSNNNKHH